MKIMLTNNYMTNAIADILIADNVHPDYAELLVSMLNQQANYVQHYVLMT